MGRAFCEVKAVRLLPVNVRDIDRVAVVVVARPAAMASVAHDPIRALVAAWPSLVCVP
jgi:hypothetical protein